MTFPLSQVLKPTLQRQLTALHACLGKAAAHASDNGIDEIGFLQARLAPDMFPMIRQPQIACDVATRGAARLADHDVPSFPDDEDSFAALQNRVMKARDFVLSVSDADLDAGAERDITFPRGRDATMTLAGPTFLLNFILPNVYFHVTTAYNLLRAGGVPLSKNDFLGAMEA